MQFVPDSDPPGLGEPINIVVGNHSDPQVLTPEGFTDFMLALNFSYACLGLESLNMGIRQSAHLGDGNGILSEQGDVSAHKSRTC